MQPIVYRQNHPRFLVFVIALLFILSLIFLGVLGSAFRDVGFSSQTIAMILLLTFLGSYVNVPLAKIKTTVPIIRIEYTSFLGLRYRIPRIDYVESSTILAVNVGGAAIPTILSLYLLWKQPWNLVYSVLGIIIVTIVTNIVSVPTRGVGITTPAFIPPIVAAIVAIILPSSSPKMIAYVSGVLGTLIGADIMNIHKINRLGAPIASIGGAGTFDGVFLSGILAVLLI